MLVQVRRAIRHATALVDGANTGPVHQPADSTRTAILELDGARPKCRRPTFEAYGPEPDTVAGGYGRGTKLRPHCGLGTGVMARGRISRPLVKYAARRSLQQGGMVERQTGLSRSRHADERKRPHAIPVARMFAKALKVHSEAPTRWIISMLRDRLIRTWTSRRSPRSGSAV